MKYLSLIIVFAALFIHVPQLSAKDPVKVKVNTPTHVRIAATRDRGTCEWTPPLAHGIGRQPKHGKVKIATRMITVPKTAKECVGKRVKVLVITYTPERGYRGPDSFTYTMQYNRYVSSNDPHRAYRVKVIVE